MALNMRKGWYGESHRHSLARKGVKTVQPTFKDRPNKIDFPKGKGLDIHTAITVPSTKEADKPITRAEHERRAREVETFLSKKFGGYTEIKGGGGWVSKEKGLIKEPVLVVHSYTDEGNYKKNEAELEGFLQAKKKDWSQENLSYEFQDFKGNQGLHLI